MKPQDLTAITAGTLSGAAIAESAESVIASAAAAIAVYLFRLLISAIQKRMRK